METKISKVHIYVRPVSPLKILLKKNDLISLTVFQMYFNVFFCVEFYLLLLYMMDLIMTFYSSVSYFYYN